MNDQLHVAVSALYRLLARLQGLDFADDRGVEDSPAKMIWIAAAIVIAGLATVFAIALFNDAKDAVPDPAVPGGGGGGG